MEVPRIVSLEGPERVASDRPFLVFVHLEGVGPRSAALQVACSHEGVVTNPFKQWPMPLMAPPQHEWVNVPLYSLRVTRTIAVTLYVGERDADMTDPDNWQAQTTVQIDPESPEP